MATASTETVSLFRAVRAVEREDILLLDGFRTILGQMEAKQFALTLEDAVAFGKQVVERYDKETFWIVEVVLPKTVLNYCLLLELDTRPAYSVHYQELTQFNQAIQHLIWYE